MFGCCRWVSRLTLWLLLLLLLKWPLWVNLAVTESHSLNCDRGEYLTNGFCCKVCPAGTFVQMPCTIPRTQGQCEKCQPGTFTESDNGLDSCIHCSTCDKDQEMVADCSATSDRKCQCQTHYYSDPERPELCHPCTKCPQGFPVLQECNSTADTVCSQSASGPNTWLFLLLLPLSGLIILIIAAVYQYLQYLKKIKSWAVVAHAFNPSTQEAEAGLFLSSRPAWSTE